jgi:predicted DNA-binding transcriptional regulator YafY
MSDLRLRTILYKLRSNHYPISADEILNYLEENEIYTTKRTLYRDFAKMRDEFNCEIIGRDIEVDGRTVRGYLIDQTDLIHFDAAESFLNVTSAVELFKKEIGTTINPHQYISFGRGTGSGGALWLRMLSQSMIKLKIVKFEYLKYGQTEATKRSVKPYYLKSYNHLWYLLCKTEKTDEIKIFGLDRVKNLSVTDVSFERDRTFKPLEYFKNHIGVFVDDNLEVETIQIEVEDPYAEKIKMDPLHWSQTIIRETKNVVTIKLQVVPNGEFYSEILKMRNHAKIISPQVVQRRMKEIVERMGEKYA